MSTESDPSAEEATTPPAANSVGTSVSPTEIVEQCWFLVGATAGGKTAVSIELAKAIDAEIISMDSMAIYRAMDVGTAKPSMEVRNEIPHHLIDMINPDQSFSTSQYHWAACEVVKEILGRGKTPLFVGGTALYLKTMLRGLFEGPPADWDFRKEVQKDIDQFGDEFLLQRLEFVDPVLASQLHPHDHRRIIRALEVFRATGKPLGHLQNEFDRSTPPEQCRVFAIRHPRPRLHQRIEQRVEGMFANGLVDEARSILEQFGTLSHTALQAVGYKEAISFLNDEVSMEEAIESSKIRTRRFARHQETWFRGLEECRMVDLDEGETAAQTVERLQELARTVGDQTG